MKYILITKCCPPQYLYGTRLLRKGFFILQTAYLTKFEIKTRALKEEENIIVCETIIGLYR